MTAGRPREAGAPLNFPIGAVSTFSHGAERIYSRGDGTPAWEALETVLGGLEQADAVVYASGMGAVTAIFSLLDHGSRVLLPTDCYHGVVALAEQAEAQGRLQIERCSVTDTDAWCSQMGTVDLAWLESPTNPLLDVGDLARILSAGAASSTLVAVDNTFATPLRQQPLAMGADLAMQSTTKFIGGHSDLLGGVVTSRQPELIDSLRQARTVMGATPGSLETFLALRGVRTMALRLDQSEASAQELVARLQQHPSVGVVRYPGFGSMVSFDLANAAVADRFCESLQLVLHATSLGGVESTLERRAGTPGQEHLPAGLIRMSVGCEDVNDLWNDMTRSLDASG